MERNLKIILPVLVLVASWIFYERGQGEANSIPSVDLVDSDRVLALSEKPTQVKALEKPPSRVPDFAAIQDVNQKKQAFIDFILPAIYASNKAIAVERDFLKQLKPNQMSVKQKQRFEALAVKYQQPRKKDQTMVQWHADLLIKVDIIPPALALAQAANESAWGTSRFAVEGMNFFGHWCFSVGCGLVPERRPEGQIYEVRVFNSVEDSVAAYMLNLNALINYETLRNLRAQLRQSKQALNSELLAYGLIDYSAKREDYIRELQAMIRFNRWQHYDKKPKGEWHG
ncbi:glucosaminidase domain-containing protein [Thiomicrospira microaerophila]|uniref:glucosaminidase domain-containing protein n=1 Tax=Thiomicrospira microaerophila TaxID=406020 RepID=UPI0006977D2D|nr:glucosaminidase domain-containing protein [Thiomicrospira microaerophila]